MVKITEEFIGNNLQLTCEILEKYDNSELRDLIGAQDERYMMAPASTRDEYYCAFPGGLCYHNLNVFKKLKALNKVLGNEYTNQSLAKLAFLHSFGKIGNEMYDYYTPKKSDWHNEKGIWYEMNPEYGTECVYMTVPHSSILWAKDNDIPLTDEEYVAILLSEGIDSDNGKYTYRVPKLAMLLKTAIDFACEEENKLEVER
jgi:hypothetical protein